ncbi:MAG: hypothetical protein ABEI99_11990 [Halobaculum sp.]
MPSRRQLLGAVGAVLTTGVAGCAGVPTGDQTATATATSAGGDPRVAVRLVGPETDATLFDGDDAASVGTVQESRGGAPYFTVTLTDDAAATVSKTFREAGVADDPSAFEVVVRHGGESLDEFGISKNLAESIASGEWDESFLLQFESVETARSVRTSFAAGTED